jgi:hypothetical protein
VRVASASFFHTAESEIFISTGSLPSADCFSRVEYALRRFVQLFPIGSEQYSRPSPPQKLKKTNGTELHTQENC